MPAGGRGHVLISYAHEDEHHRANVGQLARLLTDAGINIVIDQSVGSERQDWASWTLERIRDADRVLIVVSAQYRERFEGTVEPDVGRGVQFEGLIIREEIYRDQRAGLLKFVPVLLGSARQDDVPTLLRPYSTTHYRVPELSISGVAEIVNLLRQPLRPVSEIADLPQDEGPCASLHLALSGGTAAGADQLVRELLGAAGGGSALFTADTRSAGAYLVGSPATVLDALSRATRTIFELIRAQQVHGKHRIRAELGAHMDIGSVEARGGAAALAMSDVARRMHAVRDADFVVVVSEAFYAEIKQATHPHPQATAYRECADSAVSGGTCWISVPGRSRAPALPVSPPRDLLPPAAATPAERQQSSPTFVTGPINGTVNQIAGDAWVHVVQHFGSLP